MPEQTEEIKCCNCRATIGDDNIITQNGESYCEECHSEIFSYCESCDSYHDTETSRIVSHRRNGRLIETCVCEVCFSENYFECSDCNGSCHNEQRNEIANGDIVCNSCYEDNYFTCEECGDAQHTDNHHEENVCSECYNSNRRGGIQDYGSRAPLNFFGKCDKGIYYGIELEVEAKDSEPETHAEKVNAIMGSFVICKEDGSLHNGFEIVTCPATIDEQKKKWDLFFAEKWSKAGLRSWDTSTCGLHVHVSRAPLSELTIAKALVFINSPNNIAFIRKIAGRSQNRYCQIKDKKYKDVKLPSDRYEALNLCSKHTIEFRLFKGSLKKETFFKALEFCQAVIELCSPAQRSLRECQSVSAFIIHIEKNKKQWPNLFDFIKNRMPILLSETDQSNENH